VWEGADMRACVCVHAHGLQQTSHTHTRTFFVGASRPNGVCASVAMACRRFVKRASLSACAACKQRRMHIRVKDGGETFFHRFVLCVFTSE
jgi:hypothetical protein